MSLQSWSTEHIAPAERLTFWNNAVCRAVLNVAIEDERADPAFSGTISVQKYGDVSCASFSSSHHRVVRRSRDIHHARNSPVLLSFQEEGFAKIASDKGSFVLGPGEIAILDAANPWTLSFSDHVRRLILVLPRDQLFARCPWLAKANLCKIGSEFPYRDFAAAYMRRLAETGFEIDRGEASVLTENLCNLVALGTSGKGFNTDDRDGWGLTTDAVLSFMNLHMTNSRLTPKAVADALHVSPRTIHKRFEEIGTTFGRWLLHQRLSKCAASLRDPRQAGVSISQVALNWGFNDLSYFNRSFRSCFSVTPREWRRGSSAPTFTLLPPRD
jgi:AraC family transcriptional activator of tynA and feaB